MGQADSVESVYLLAHSEKLIPQYYGLFMLAFQSRNFCLIIAS